MNDRNAGSFLFTILISLILLASATVAFASGSVINDGVIEWTGQGSENLPCEFGGHWVLAPAFGIDTAVLTVNGSDYTMSQSGQGSWSADSSGPLDVGLSAYVTYTGPGDESNHLQLSHCIEGQNPTPTPTEVDPTATPTEFPPTATPTENPPTSTPTGTPLTPTSTPPGPTATPTNPGPTATPTQPNPTQTPTQPRPTLTPTEPAPTATATPKPPVPAIGDDEEPYPGKLLGTLTIDGRAFELYQGVNAPDGTLQLPSSVRGAALYENGIWVHRAWNSGWVVITPESKIVTTFLDGFTLEFAVKSQMILPYGSYPETNSLYIASCYADENGNWAGVIIYILE